MKPTVVNKYKDRYDVYIGRGSKWGNPFPITKTNTREQVIAQYKEWITEGEGKHLLNDLHELAGKRLGCFCKPKACHGDVLVELFNKVNMKFKEYSPMQYLAIDIANHFGLDKLDYDDRISWVKHNLDCLETKTVDAEEPLLYSKAVKALRDVQQGKPTNYAVAFDSVNSGLQLMSVMMKCSKGARLTGIGTANRVDGYSEITKAINEQLDSELQVSRKDAKRAVMTSLYGSKAEPTEVFGEAVYVFYEVMQQECTGAWELLEMLLGAWNSEATVHQWLLPDNHLAYVPVMDTETKRINVSEGDFEYTPVVQLKVNKPIEHSVSLAANAIHSVDAWVLRSLVRRCNYDKFKLEDFLRLEQIKPIENNIHWFNERFHATQIADIAMIYDINISNVNEVNPELFNKLKTLARKVLSYPSFPVIVIHDSFSCHPNHMTRLRMYYNEILANLCDSTYVEDLLNQLYGDEGEVKKGTLTSDEILNSNYALT